MALYVKFAEEKKPTTVREFLKLFYGNEIQKNPCFLKSVDTFKDKQCKYLHCDKTFRSFDDIIEVVKTYYPKVKDITIFKYLLTNNFKNKEIKFYPHLGMCSEMQKIRFIPYKFSNYSDLNVKMTQSKYKWEDLLEKLEIKNEEDFKNYIKNRK